MKIPYAVCSYGNETQTKRAFIVFANAYHDPNSHSQTMCPASGSVQSELL